jgi:hypothetical protein
VEEIVGQGAYGRVFRARDLEGGGVVALKEFVRRDGKGDSFLRELGILFELAHPHVIACHSLVMAGAFRYLVCEFMEAGSLRDLLVAQRTPTRDLLRLLREVAEGVAYAHEHNVVHRDLKPENVLLGVRDGRLIAKVSDFGISTLGTSLGRHSSIGSPAYMAPEQFYDQYDARVDVYALGVMLYEILCGRRPFHGSPAQLMLGHIRREPSWPLWLPRLFARVLRRALAKKPPRRFATVRAFIEALDLAMGAEGGELDRDAWPFALPGVTQLALAGDDLLVGAEDALRRLDARGRLVELAAPVDALVSAGALQLVVRGDTATVLDAHGARPPLTIPRGARVALSCEGGICFVHAGGAYVVERGQHHQVAAEKSSVVAACFVGREQTLMIARELEIAGRIETSLGLGAAEVRLPEPIAAVWGNPTRYEAVARSAIDRRRLFLIRAFAAEPIELACGAFSCDGECFYAVTDEGELASLAVGSSRVARTRWSSPLAHVAAAEGSLAWATVDGAVGRS